jgi:hypothetical protein
VAERVEKPLAADLQNETLLLQFELFQQLLTEIMRQEMKVIELRRKLIQQQDYSIRGVMQALDGHAHGWVCGEDLQKYLKNYGVEAGLRQVEKLVEVVNYTLDGRVTEEQLKWTVEGFENKNKTYLEKIKKANKKQFEKKRDESQNHTPRTAKSILTEERTTSVNKTHTTSKATPSVNRATPSDNRTTSIPNNKATPTANKATPIYQHMASPQPSRDSPALPKTTTPAHNAFTADDGSHQR